MNIFLGRRREVTNVAIIDSTYFECEYIDTSLATNTGIVTNIASRSTHWVLDIKPNDNTGLVNRLLIFRATTGNNWLYFNDHNVYATYRSTTDSNHPTTILVEQNNPPLRRTVKVTFHTNGYMRSFVDTNTVYNFYNAGGKANVQLFGGSNQSPFLGVIYRVIGYKFRSQLDETTNYEGPYEENPADIVVDIVPAYNIHTTVYGLYDKKNKVFYPIEGATGEIKYI